MEATLHTREKTPRVCSCGGYHVAKKEEPFDRQWCTACAVWCYPPSPKRGDDMFCTGGMVPVLLRERNDARGGLAKAVASLREIADYGTPAGDEGRNLRGKAVAALVAIGVDSRRKGVT